MKKLREELKTFERVWPIQRIESREPRGFDRGRNQFGILEKWYQEVRVIGELGLWGQVETRWQQDVIERIEIYKNVFESI